MRNNPSLHLDSKPEGIDTKSDDGKKEPLDVVTEELKSVTVEVKLLAIDNGVLSIPSFLKADCPGSADTKGEDDDKCLKNACAYHSKKAACEFRFHRCISSDVILKGISKKRPFLALILAHILYKVKNM